MMLIIISSDCEKCCLSLTISINPKPLSTNLKNLQKARWRMGAETKPSALDNHQPQGFGTGPRCAIITTTASTENWLCLHELGSAGSGSGGGEVRSPLRQFEGMECRRMRVRQCHIWR